MKKTYSRIFAILILILSLSGCAHRQGDPSGMAMQAASSEEEALEAAVYMRQKSVQQGDLDSFLKLIDSEYHPTYYSEQTHWFEDMKRQSVKDFTCVVDTVEKRADGYWMARLDESYEYDGRQFSCNYPVIFRISGSGDNYDAYICGYDFKKMENEYTIFYYSEQNEQLISQLSEQSVSEIERVYDIFGYRPDEKLIVNMYPGQKHLIWSVKPSLPDWVGGWAEPGESVKMCYLAAYGVDEYRTTIAHEACHMVVSDLSDNNACYWLQEGLASLVEKPSMKMTTYDKAVLSFNDGADTLFNFEQLQYEDYEALDDQFTVAGYYSACKAAAYILHRDYGVDGIMRLLEALKQQGSGKVGYSKERLAAMSDINMQVMQQVLDIDPDDYADKYDKLMEKILGE